MTNNNELAHRIFNELFDDEDLDNMKAKGIISQPLGYRLSSIAIIECELDDGCHRIADEIAELRAKIAKKNEMVSDLIEALGVSVDETSDLREGLKLMIEQFKSEHNCEYEYKIIKWNEDLLNK